MAGLQWVPGKEGVEQIVNLLTAYMQPSQDQAALFAQLQHCGTFPDFNNYLVYILASGDGMTADVRQAAGLLLKNNLKTGYATTAAEYRCYIKHHVLRSVGAPHAALRTTIGTVISVVAVADGLKSWPELPNGIVQCLYSDDYDHTHGALDALYKICEDIPQQLDEDIPGCEQRPCGMLVPRLLVLFQHPTAELRRLAVGCMNNLMTTMPAALYDNLDRYLNELFTLRNDSSVAVRSLVCAGLVQFLAVTPERLQTHLRELIQYMLQATQDPEPEVALEACEFWSAFCESHLATHYAAVLAEFLPALIPILLRNMSYAEDDEEALAEAEESNAHVEDREQDLKPFHASGRSEHGAAKAEFEDDDDDDEVNAWNLRKCSASGLDILSTVFHDKLLPIMLPIVEQRLSDPDWKVRESAILALGAVAEGCAQGLVALLPQLVKFLVPLLDDPRPLVRSITCWSLSRFSQWLLESATTSEYGQQQLDAVMAAVLKRLLDGNKRVQEAACSAVATLEEEAGARNQLTAARVDTILQHLLHAFNHYQRKNLRILYDALGTLADQVGSGLNDPRLANALVPTLLHKWEALGLAHKDVLPLLECLHSIIGALGGGFQPYAELVFSRCVSLIDQTLAARRPDGELEKDFVVAALDVLCVLVEAVGPSVEALVARSSLREVIIVLGAEPYPDVRQSAFELLGDLCRACASHLVPRAGDILTLVTHNMSAEVASMPQNLSACNNACWAAGELVVRMGAEPDALWPFVGPLVQCLLPLLQPPHQPGSKIRVSKSLVENATITLGRLAGACPAQVAPALPSFLAPWCEALRGIRDDKEKTDAFWGVCKLLHESPQAGLSAFQPLCAAVASWAHFTDLALHQELGRILAAYKDYMGDEWSRVWPSVPQPIRDKLSGMFGLA